MSLSFEIAVTLILVLVNGWFALAELAVVSSRRPRLEARAQAGDKGAAMAITLAEDPGRFLSAVQIGITLVGVLAGAYSGATLAGPLAEVLADIALVAPIAEGLALGLVVGGITYASLIIGELVPKQIALANPEAVASRVSRPLALVARVAAPLLWVLDGSSRVVLGLLRVKPADEATVTEEEVRALIAEGTRSGIFEPQEKELMAGVMRFGDRSTRAIMTPRPDVVWLDLTWDRARVIQTLRDSHHSRFPVCNGGSNDVVGVAQAKDLLDALLGGGTFDLAAAVRPIEAIPDTAPALQVLDALRRSSIHMALVVDEYGTVEGIVTAADILTAIVGSLAEPDTEPGDGMVLREDGSWLVDGDVPVDEAAERIGCPLDDPDEGDFQTVAGFILAHRRSIPVAGDAVVWRGWRYEVVDMDGRRIDKVLIGRLPGGGQDGA